MQALFLPVLFKNGRFAFSVGNGYNIKRSCIQQKNCFMLYRRRWEDSEAKLPVERGLEASDPRLFRTGR